MKLTKSLQLVELILTASYRNTCIIPFTECEGRMVLNNLYFATLFYMLPYLTQ